jgi:hypothetical protein
MPYGGSASNPPSFVALSADVRDGSKMAPYGATSIRLQSKRLFRPLLRIAGGGRLRNANPVGPYWTASPLIVPDVATVGPYASQTFRVQNAQVVQFLLSADQHDWSGCVAIDPEFSEANGIRLLALHRCRGLCPSAPPLGNSALPSSRYSPWNEGYGSTATHLPERSTSSITDQRGRFGRLSRPRIQCSNSASIVPSFRFNSIQVLIIAAVSISLPATT